MSELIIIPVDEIGGEGQCESLYIKVMFRDPELCQSLMEEILVYIEEIKEKIEEQTGKFEINLIDKSFSVVYDSELISKQESVAVESFDERTRYLNRISEMNDDMKTYFNYLMMEYASEEQKEKYLVEVPVNNTESSSGFNVDVKTVALAVMALEICAIAVLLLFMFFAGKIIYDDDWKHIFNIDYLGQLETRKTKRVGYRLDRWINSKSTLVVDKEIFAGILSLRVNNTASTVAFLCLEKYDEEMSEELSQISSIFGGKMKIIIIDEVMSDADSLHSIDEADNYIICAKRGRTGIDKIGALVQLISSRNGKIIGGLEWE